MLHKEASAAGKLIDIGVSPVTARALLQLPPTPPLRLNASLSAVAPIWINDIASDAHFADWTSDPGAALLPMGSGAVQFVRANIFTLLL